MRLLGELLPATHPPQQSQRNRRALANEHTRLYFPPTPRFPRLTAEPPLFQQLLCFRRKIIWALSYYVKKTESYTKTGEWG